MILLTLSVKFMLLLTGVLRTVTPPAPNVVLQQVTPPAPNPGGAASFPINFDNIFGAILSIGMKIGVGIGALVFAFMLAGALKERPVRWSAVITDGMSIVVLLIMLIQSNKIITWIAGLV